MNRRTVIAAWAACGLLLAGCRAQALKPTPTLIPTPGPLPSATSAPMLTPPPECKWDGTAEAWQDLDGNGQREAGEPPLAGVSFGVEHNGQRDPNAVYKTGADGSVSVEVRLPGCDPQNYRIVLTGQPEGYSPPKTTAQALSDANEGGVIDFGLIPAKVTETPTPGGSK